MGVMPALSIAQYASAVLRRTPETPLQRFVSRDTIIARTTSVSTSGPTPAA
jgi:hypothetical protein